MGHFSGSLHGRGGEAQECQKERERESIKQGKGYKVCLTTFFAPNQ